MQNTNINTYIESPIVFFDLETTGLDTDTARIIQIAAIKLHASGEKEIKVKLLNPGQPIPAEATAIHGITDDQVKDQPTFNQVAKSFYDFIKGCNLAGYNCNRFDLPLIINEFMRAGIYFEFNSDVNYIIDLYLIYKHYKRHDLATCYLDYTGNQIHQHHDAQADTMATIEIFENMLNRHDELKTKDGRSQFLKNNSLDLLNKIGVDQDGNKIFLFGKHKGQKLADNIEYCKWILNSNFHPRTKKVIKDALNL